jgi:hypothetical protein
MPRTLLDEYKKREILALLAVGCSQRVAAMYVGCSPDTIRRAAAREESFAQRLNQAVNSAQVTFLNSIHRAAKKEQYWRAAAWALERLNPEDFGPPKSEMLTLAQAAGLVSELARIVMEEIPVAKHRQAVIKRLEALLAGLPSIEKETPPTDQKKSTNEPAATSDSETTHDREASDASEPTDEND